MAYKRLEADVREFSTAKHKYVIKDWLTFDEWRQFEILEFQTGMGSNFDTVFKGLRVAFDMLDKNKPAQAAVHIFNLISAIKDKLDNRWHPAFMLCTLFIIRDGEEIEWSEPRAKEFIEDWKTEYEATSFFALAVGRVNGFAEAYEIASRDFSKNLLKVSNILQNGKQSETFSGTKSER